MHERDSGEIDLDRVLAAAYRRSPSLTVSAGSAGQGDTEGPALDSPALDRFEEIRPLGQGGMGEVYAARDRVLQRPVALKRIRRSLRQREEVRTRFLREARILSRLEHPNVCLLYDYVQAGQHDVLVLEWIPGQTLAAHLEEGLERGAALRVATGIAAALTAAHGAGIVHRDLKPANVMITPSGEAKVLDFGIARSGPEGGGTRASRTGPAPPGLPPRSDPSTRTQHPDGSSPDGASPESRDSAVTSRGQILGTPAYMSPEQRRGEPASPASDQYSFGLILQDLLGGELPLVRALLEPDPQQRPSAAEALRRLRSLAARPRRRALQALATGIVLAFALLGIRYVVDVRRERDHALDRQARAERLIAFLVDRVAGRIEDVGPKALIEAVDEEAVRYFRGEPGHPFSENELRRRVQALSGYARRVRTYGRLDAAKAIYRELESFLADLPPEQARASEWRYELGQVRFYLGEIARDEGDVAETGRYWDSYAALSEALVQDAPESVAFRDELAYARTNLGVLNFEQGQVEAARPLFAMAFEHWDARAQEAPSDLELKLECADALSWMAEALGASGRLQEAHEAFGREVELREALRAADPASLTSVHRLALAEHHHGRALQRSGRTDEALEVLLRGHARASRLTVSDPHRAPWRRTRVLLASTAGALLDDVGRPDEALALHGEARAGVAKLAEQDPSNGDWASLAVHVLQRAARNQCGLENPEAAAELLREVFERLERDGERVKGTAILRARARMLEGDLARSDPHPFEVALTELDRQADSAATDPLGHPEHANLRLRLLLRLGRQGEADALAGHLASAGTLGAAARREWQGPAIRPLPASFQGATR